MNSRYIFSSILASIIISFIVISGNHSKIFAQAGNSIYGGGDSTEVKIYSPNEIIKEIIRSKNGNMVTAEKVPGRPPEKYRAPIAKIPNTKAPNAIKILDNVPGYSWSFGCSATTAAMIAGYYDNKGYWKMYTGPTNGGNAPIDNSSWGAVRINGELRNLCPISASRNGLDGRTTRGHVDNYWRVYDDCADDPYITNGWPQHEKGECVGDYMKTNQSAYENCDGATTFYYYDNGEIWDRDDLPRDGLYGFERFCVSKGYRVTLRYNQRIKGFQGNANGFTFAQYKQEIDNGYPVFIHVLGHTMVGVGYNDATNKVYLHDTWDYNLHEMTWGETYAGLQHRGVSVFHLEPVDTTRYNISIFANPSNAATVFGSGTFLKGMLDTARFIANPGYTFKYWTEGGRIVSHLTDYLFGVDANRIIYANFDVKSYTVTAAASPAEGGTVTGTGTFNHGRVDTLRAIANPAYTFASWTENGAFVSYSPTYIFTVTSNRSLQANFTKRKFTVTTSCNPLTAGVVLGGGGFFYGDTDTIRASANAGYIFENWTEGGIVVSENKIFSFTVTANRNFVANFSKITYTITTLSNPPEGGTTSGGGGTQYGKTDTVFAMPNAGYSFKNWTENGTVVSLNYAYGFTVTGNRTLVANFVPNSFSISLKSNPEKGGTVKGGGAYESGKTISVEALPNAGYTFIGWAENESIVYSKPQYSFTVQKNRELIAYFAGVFLTSFNNGEVVNQGQSVNITWTSSNVANLKIEYTIDDGGKWYTITNIVSALSGSYLWTVPTAISSKCRIRLTDVLNSEITCQSSKTFTIATDTITLRGKLVYANTENTPIDGAKVYLWNPELIIDSIFTNQNGDFTFAAKKNREYLYTFEINKNHNGINSTDALLIARHYAFGAQLSTVQMKAADVNNNSSINNTDALMVLQKSAGYDILFNCGYWVTDAEIFNTGNSDYSSIIHALAAGDVNASYNFNLAKSISPYNVNCRFGKNLNGTSIELPLAIDINAAIGAATVVVGYNESSLKIKSVSSKLKGINYTIKNGKITISWADIKPVAIAVGEPLLVINAEIINNQPAVDFEIYPETEFADIEGRVIENINIKSLVKEGNTPETNTMLSNYPNPFNPSTRIQYTVEQNENVSLVIYDLLGKEVITLVNENKSPGSYNVIWQAVDNNGNRVPSGIYIYRLVSGENVITKKMTLLK